MKKFLTRVASLTLSLFMLVSLFLPTSALAQACGSDQTCITIHGAGARCIDGNCVAGGSGATISPPAAFFGNVGDLINSVLTFVVAIAALLVFLYLIWGGIDWITSGGDKGKTEAARNKITAAVVGLIILAAAYAILTIALGFLAGGSDLNDLLIDAGIVS